LIRTPDDRLVFLEINPNGQFLFVEDRVPQLRLGDAMADLLTRLPRRGVAGPGAGPGLTWDFQVFVVCPR
jgi:hypothetical protein